MAKKFYLAEALDTKTGVFRRMSLPAQTPLLDGGPKIAECAETMLDGFVNQDRPAKDYITKYHFINWCAMWAKYGNPSSRFQIAFAIANKNQYDEFNQCKDFPFFFEVAAE